MERNIGVIIKYDRLSPAHGDNLVRKRAPQTPIYRCALPPFNRQFLLLHLLFNSENVQSEWIFDEVERTTFKRREMLSITIC